MSASCEVCGKPVPDYVPKFCCNAFDCGCGGKPVEPCICSEECWERMYGDIQTAQEEHGRNMRDANE